jgi:hypothetical protein
MTGLAVPDQLIGRTKMSGSGEDKTGESRRWNSGSTLARSIRVLIAGVAACTLLLLTATFLWQILKAAGDLAGASTFLAMSVVIFGAWLAHWFGLILLNSLSLAQSPPNKGDHGLMRPDA